jgi:hypothetical protein
MVGYQERGQFTVPNVITKWANETELSALISAHWSEYIMEQLVLQNVNDRGALALDAAELQLVLHTLERAKLETALYAEALDKEVEFFHSSHPEPSTSTNNGEL